MASLFGLGPKLSVIGKEHDLLDAARTGNFATVEKLLTKQEKGKKSTVGKLTRYGYDSMGKKKLHTMFPFQ